MDAMSEHERDYAEKRDFIRMRIDADVSLIHAGQEITGTCVDLSSSGMQGAGTPPVHCGRPADRAH